MKRIPLFFLLSVTVNYATGAEAWHSGMEHMRTSNDDRVNFYNEQLKVVINNNKKAAKLNGTFDRLVVYTGRENIFNDIKSDGDFKAPYGSGMGLLDQMEAFTKMNLANKGRRQCIPNLTVLSHGWGATRTSGGKGLPVADNSEHGYPVTGFYEDDAARRKEVMQSVNDYMSQDTKDQAKYARDYVESAEFAKTFAEKFNRQPGPKDKELMLNKMTKDFQDSMKDQAAYRARLFKQYNERSAQDSADLGALAAKIKSRDIEFCQQCLIQMYSCNLDEDFVKKLALTTGCQVVYGSGKVTGGYLPNADGTPVVKNGQYVDSNDSKYSHFLVGSQASGKDASGKIINKNTRDGQFRRITPIGGGQTVAESIGKSYTLLK